MAEVAEVELKRVKPSGLNPRTAPDPQKLAELAQSMKEIGLIQPVLLRPKGEGFEVVVGERRVKAAEKAGLKKIPAVIRKVPDDNALEMILIENIQREGLSDVEKGKTAKLLTERFPKKYPTKSELAHKIGVDHSAVVRWVEAVEIVPREVQELIAPAEPTTGKIPKGKISGDMAVTIARKIKEPEKAARLAKEIARRGVTKPIARKLITKIVKEPEKPVRQIFKEVVEEVPVELPFRYAHVGPIIKGIKTQTSRIGLPPNLKKEMMIHAALWEPHFADLRVVDIQRKRLGDFTEEDAKREGGYTLGEFRNVWESIHGKGSWDPDQRVDVILFELVRAYPIEALTAEQS